ncbi:MAG: mechanosensitive ion channel family protein [Flavobacteriales bacterium]
MNDLFNTTLTLGHHTLTVLELMEALLVFLVARIFLAVVRRGLRRAQRLSSMDEGKQFIVRRLVTSVVWALAAMVALSVLGVDLTALWAGSAALLVGVGIGLQGFFNDVISGFVLLFEGGVAVGNVLEVDGKLVRVERIDLRSTRVVTVAGELIVLPNSKVAGEAVVNLTQGDSAMRIRVNVGVAYGSDVDLVMRLLSEAMSEQPEVRSTPQPAVFFQEFADSSLNFSVMGWLDDPWDRMGIQSRVRTAIDAKFRAHGVTIPFPQRDLHIVTSPEGAPGP